MHEISPGTLIANRVLTTLKAKTAEIPDPSNIVHLQFRRFAGCPFCSVHLRAFAQRHEEIIAAGIREVVVFQSTAAALLRHHGDVPFAIVPDPQGKLYTEFGIQSGGRALLNPRVLMTALPNVIRMLPKLPGIPRWGQGALVLPADFLITPDARILACKYGAHADDQWSVDELLTLVRRSHELPAPIPNVE